MEEIRLWIKDVGFPIAVACASMWAMYRLFMMRESERLARNDRVADAIVSNTEATKDLTTSLRGWGSDPFAKIQCRATTDLAEKIAIEVAKAMGVRECQDSHPDCPLTKVNPLQPKQGT